MTVFFDIDTQLDFMLPAGALYVPGAEHMLPAIARLNQFAGTHGIPLISTTDAHAENDPEFRTYPPHCVGGTIGQTKPFSTVLDKRTVLPDKRIAPFSLAPQIVLQKTVLNAFSNANLPTLLDSFG